MQWIHRNVSVALPDWTPALWLVLLEQPKSASFAHNSLADPKPSKAMGLTPCYDHDCLTAAMQPGFCAVGTMSHQNVSLNIINLTCRLNSFEIERNDTLPFVLPLTLSVQHYVLTLHSFMQCCSRNCRFEKLEYEKMSKPHTCEAAIAWCCRVWLDALHWNLCRCLPGSTFNISVKHLRLKRVKRLTFRLSWLYT